MKHIAVLLGLGLLCGCATTQPSKQLFFRTRLPTTEVPVFKKEKGFGARLEVENQRFTVKATRNLVSDFTFYKDNYYTSSGDSAVGFDGSLTYREAIWEFPIELGLSGDFVEIKYGLLGFRPNENSEYKVMVNFGSYSSSAWTEESECTFPCLENRETSRAAENGISVAPRGSERKIGLTLSKLISERAAVFTGFQWMDYVLSATASKAGSSDIEFRQSFYSSGLGLGILYTGIRGHTVAGSVDRVLISWDGDRIERYVFSLRTNFEF